MTRTLVLIAIVGFLVSVVCFGAVGAMGGIGWHGDWDWNDRHHGVHRSAYSGGGGTTTREIAWQGATALEFSLPARIRYVQGAQPKITITGSPEMVRAVRVEGGHIYAPNIHWPSYGMRRLEIAITAPAVTRFELNGSQDLDIDGYRQNELRIEVHGSGDITGRGQARQLELEIAGSGDADLSDLVVTDARVGIAGSGDAIVAPTGLADIEIAGSGDVRLTRRPAKLVSDIAGSGDIRQDGGDIDESEAPDEAKTGV